MKILYVAKHGSGGNDDEEAIAHALRQLGHQVTCVNERGFDGLTSTKYDFMLCHHFHNFDALKACIAPKVFWCFDRIHDDDPTLARRCEERGAWLARMIELCHVGFMTDGDAVTQWNRLHWLPQGADERVVGRGTKVPHRDIPILFTGAVRGCGAKRQSFVDEMVARYSPNFVHVVKGIHGRAMADLIATSRIVVAPDFPISDRYWSNRVYNVLGFGGFLLHPRCTELSKHYTSGVHYIAYDSREQLHQLIDDYLRLDLSRQLVQQRALDCTIKEHTYRHRCEQLVATVKEVLGV